MLNGLRARSGHRPSIASPANGLLFTVIILSCFAPVVAADIVEVEYTFDSPSVEIIKIDGEVFDRINMPGAPNSGAIGYPALPCFGAHILLPYGAKVESIEIVTGKKVLIGEGYSIEPVDRPFILSSPDQLPPIYKNPDVYRLNEAIPRARIENCGIQYLHGHRILVLRLYPMEYIPATGSLSYYVDISVKVHTAPSDKISSMIKSSKEIENDIVGTVDNPAEISSYRLADKSGAETYDMLIITSADLVEAFMPLKDYHDSTGVLTEIHTLDQIGGSDPHLIRDYIRQEYLNNGIQYVALGGDDNLIPSLKLYVVSWDGAGAVTEYKMPADFYFSCLDGTFNYDNDAYWGEPDDGEGGGEIDLFPEVHVGRISAESPQEVTNLVNKTLSYVSSQDPYLQKVLLAGEQLTFGGWGEYGGYAMDEMVNYSNTHGYMTYAFPEDVYDIEKLYDYLIQPNNYWPPSAMISRINSGFHIIDHLGHSGPGYAMRTDTTMLRLQLNNTQYGFIYAEGCSAGQFDVTDCWAEYVTTVLPDGAFGCVANARLGLGSRSTRHPVHVFNREFWDAVYNGAEGKPQIGRAISDAKADHAHLINYPGVRWTLYELTLFGDPAIAIKSVQSVAISFPEGLPENIPPYTEVTFGVLAAGIGEAVPVSGSGQLHYTIDAGEMQMAAMVEVSPNLYEATLPALPCAGSISFNVSVEESVVGRFYYPSLTSPIELSPVSDSVILFEDDFESDMGWSISGGLWARGVPAGQGGTELQYPVPDPTEGCDGPNVMGYNLNGDYENNLSAAYITSPAIDCSGRDNVYLRFCRWLGVEQPIYDEAKVLASNDGINWTQVWINYATIGDLAWEPMEYDISAVAANQSTVYLRWVMGPTDGGLRFNGWNIDDVRVLSYECAAFLCGDANRDENTDVADAVFLINHVFKGGFAPDPNEAGDANGDGSVNVADAVYLINYVFKGGPEPCCP